MIKYTAVILISSVLFGLVVTAYAKTAESNIPASSVAPKSSATPTPSSTPAFAPTSTPSPAATPTPVPTVKPTIVPPVKPTPVSTPKPTIAPTPVPTPPPTPVPTPTPSVATVQGNSFIDQINNYRNSLGLPPVSSDSYTCNFAKIRAEEIVSNFSHDGFNSRVSGGTLPYPSYKLVTENLAITGNSADVVNMWINSPGHAANLRANTTYACVEVSGNYYAYEAWTP